MNCAEMKHTIVQLQWHRTALRILAIKSQGWSLEKGFYWTPCKRSEDKMESHLKPLDAHNLFIESASPRRNVDFAFVAFVPSPVISAKVGVMGYVQTNSKLKLERVWQSLLHDGAARADEFPLALRLCMFLYSITTQSTIQ